MFGMSNMIIGSCKMRMGSHVYFLKVYRCTRMAPDYYSKDFVPTPEPTVEPTEEGVKQVVNVG